MNSILWIICLAGYGMMTRDFFNNTWDYFKPKPAAVAASVPIGRPFPMPDPTRKRREA